jgi:hypothetical protein
MILGFDKNNTTKDQQTTIREEMEEVSLHLFQAPECGKISSGQSVHAPARSDEDAQLFYR